MGKEEQQGIRNYYLQKIDEYQHIIREKTENLRRLEAQRNELNSKGNRTIMSYFIYA
jgi:26S proteasome regulatory subunit T6